MSSGSALLASVLPVLYVGGLLAIGLAVSLLLRRVQRVAAFRQLHPWIPVLHVAVWGPIIMVLEGRVPDFDGPRALGRSIGLLILALAALPWLRSVFHGLVSPYELATASATTSRSAPSRAASSPSASAPSPCAPPTAPKPASPTSDSPARPSSASTSTPATPPAGAEAQGPSRRRTRPRRRARPASRGPQPLRLPALLPDVFLGPRDGRVTDFVLRIRGYLFDREHEERYRSNVVERLHSSFVSERAASPVLAPSAAPSG